MTRLCVHTATLEIYNATVPGCGADTQSSCHNRLPVAFCQGEKGGEALPETDPDGRGNYPGKMANKGVLAGPE